MPSDAATRKNEFDVAPVDIPFEVSTKSQKEVIHDEGVKAFREMRAMAEAGLFPDLTLDEINEEIRLAREERAEREKVSV